uniref:Uncharacterized protein n=1 Tax=Curvibacter symbiont subsp. Hydra magnipapillata TaxID=667019 RepID=C9Y940_CURXX|nr:hypothetical protein Csp_A06410 [Curvibacter putative symbiont of Hydra magnipapillata]
MKTLHGSICVLATNGSNVDRSGPDMVPVTKLGLVVGMYLMPCNPIDGHTLEENV